MKYATILAALAGLIREVRGHGAVTDYVIVRFDKISPYVFRQ
jgi:hypothetical protein